MIIVMISQFELDAKHVASRIRSALETYGVLVDTRRTNSAMNRIFRTNNPPVFICVDSFDGLDTYYNQPIGYRRKLLYGCPMENFIHYMNNKYPLDEFIEYELKQNTYNRLYWKFSAYCFLPALHIIGEMLNSRACDMCVYVQKYMNLSQYMSSLHRNMSARLHQLFPDESGYAFIMEMLMIDTPRDTPSMQNMLFVNDPGRAERSFLRQQQSMLEQCDLRTTSGRIIFEIIANPGQFHIEFQSTEDFLAECDREEKYNITIE